jgi:hypothetical protein
MIPFGSIDLSMKALGQVSLPSSEMRNWDIESDLSIITEQ